MRASSSRLPSLRSLAALLVAGGVLLTGQPAATAAPGDWDGRPGSAGESWREHFRHFNSVESEDRPGAAPSTITAVDASTWRIRKPAGRKRAEASRALGWAPAEGSTYYLRWRLTVTSPRPIDRGFTVFQWKTDDGEMPDSSKQNYPFNLAYDGRTLAMNTFGPAEPNWTAGASINERRETIWSRSVAPGTPVDVVIGVTVSRDAARGGLELWVDGRHQRLSNGTTRQPHRTNDGVVVYPKWGAYGGAAIPLDLTVDVANLRIDRTRPSGTGTTTTGALVGAGSGRCAAASGGATVDRTPIVLWDCNGRPTQAWVRRGDTLVNRGSGRCLDVVGASSTPGTPVQLWPCHGGRAQQWVARPDGGLVNPGSGVCLDATGEQTANGTRLQTWTCPGTAAPAHQSWALR